MRPSTVTYTLPLTIKSGRNHQPYDSPRKMNAQTLRDMQEKLHAIFPNIEIPPDVEALRISPRERAAAQRANDARLAKPKARVSRKRWEIELARQKDEALKPPYPEKASAPMISSSRCSFFRVCSRKGPLHLPDPERRQAALAMRAARQEKLAQDNAFRPQSVSSSMQQIRHQNINAGVSMLEALKQYQEFERLSAMRETRPGRR